MGAESSKENSRSNTLVNRGDYPRQRENVYVRETATHHTNRQSPQSQAYETIRQSTSQASTYQANQLASPQAKAPRTVRRPPSQSSYQANQLSPTQAPAHQSMGPPPSQATNKANQLSSPQTPAHLSMGPPPSQATNKANLLSSPQAPAHQSMGPPPSQATNKANQLSLSQTPAYESIRQSPSQAPTANQHSSPQTLAHQSMCPPPSQASTANQQSSYQALTYQTIQQSLPQIPIERDRKPYSYTTADLQNAVKQSNPEPSLERSRQPYNFRTDELQNGTKHQVKPQSTLYPNLNIKSEEDFVHVNFFGEQRTYPLQPSAHPAAQVLNTKTSARTAQQFTSPNAAEPSEQTNSPANKNRPRSANARNRGDQDKKICCPTCGQRLGLNIFQCGAGHSCCKECRLADRVCGTCQSPITDMRNIMLEACIAEMKSPCQNQGCTLSFNGDEMEKHYKECPFGEIDCPMGTYFGQCPVRCKVADMAAHFDDFHKEQRTAEIDKEMYVFNVCLDTHKIYLIKNGPFTFLVHVKVGEQDRKVSMTVQLFGTKISASKWTYEIHVYNKRQPLRKYLYVDNCQPISTSVDDIIKDGQCATLPLPYAMTFVNESALTYKFFIKREVNHRGKKGGPRNNIPTPSTN